MANYLDFDGTGRVMIPNAVATGDFTVEFDQLTFSVINAIEIIIGNNAGAGDYIACFQSGSQMDTRIGGSGNDHLFAEVGRTKYKVQRIGSTVRKYINDVEVVGSSTTNTNTFTLSSFSGYNGGTFPYNGELAGSVSMLGFSGGGDRLYDIANSTGTTLTDTISGLDGTLSGFVTGGLVADSDTVAPVIVLVGDNPLTLTQGTPYSEPGFTATDDVDGDITANVVVGGAIDENTISSQQLTYDVDDAAGNSATQVIRTVDVVSGVDVTPPVIVLIGDNPLTLVQGTPYVEPGFTATDDVDGDVTANVIVTGAIDENTVSSQQLAYDVDDAAGNSAIQVIRTVDVVVASDLVILTSPTNYLCKQRDGSGNAQFQVTGTFVTSELFEYSVDAGVSFTDLTVAPATSFDETITINGQVNLIVRAKTIPGSAVTVLLVTAALGICEAPSQSNGAGRVTNLQPVTLNGGDPVPIMHKNGSFLPLADPVSEEVGATGSLWPGTASRFANDGVPVCVYNPAVGGSSISMWGILSSRYLNIRAFADLMGGLEILTSLIGETDAQTSTLKAEFKADYIATTQPISVDYGARVMLTYFPVGTSLNANPDRVANIRLANDELIAENVYIEAGGDLVTINIDNDVGSDGLHIKSDEDAVEGGRIRYNAFTGMSTISMDITNVPDGAIDTRVIDPVLKTVLLAESVVWASGTATVAVASPVGVALEYYVIGATDGGIERGVST